MTELLTIEFGLLMLGLAAFIVFRWGFRTLPHEAWQIAIAVPARINGTDGRIWPAINFTFYGLISAVAYGLSVWLFVFLIGAMGQPVVPAVAFASLLLVVGIPASKVVARWVEGIPGHTIGGAVFAVIISALPAMTATRWLAAAFELPSFNAGIVMAAACISYVLGEAIGRLACLSFGCCYGKPIDDCTSLQKALYSRFTETYRGRFKKISYASGLNDKPVVAVQAIASALLFSIFLLSLWLFWKGQIAASIVASLGLSQLWRTYSEQLRADFRGREGFTLYQAMALAGACLSVVFAWLYGGSNTALSTASAYRGWLAATQAEVIVASQLLAFSIVFYMGRSSVTSSRLELLLHHESTQK